MTRVYMIRHGETDWNKAHRLQGWSDIPLNERGRAQAACAAKMMASVPLDVIYTSPLKRAVETAEIIRGKTAVPVISEKGFIEINLGRWDGHSPEEMDELYPGQYDIWRSTPGDVHIDGGESFTAVQERAWKSFLSMTEKNRGNIYCWYPIWAVSAPSFSKSPAMGSMICGSTPSETVLSAEWI